MSCQSLSLRARKRTLSEDQLIRILRRGGMCLSSAGRWQVYRTQDKRSACVGTVLSHVLERLEVQGDICPARRQPNRRIWCGADQSAEAVTPLPVPESLRPRRGEAAGQMALEAALGLEADTVARIRLLAAARRYMADWEQAATPDSVTMQWGQSRVDGGRDLSRGAGPGGRALAAGARLATVHKALPIGQQRIVNDLTIHGVSIQLLERRLGVDKGQGAIMGHAALTELAVAYDLSVRAV